MGVWLKRFLYLLGLILIIAVTMLMTMPVQFMAIQWGFPDNVRIGAMTGALQSGRANDLVYSQRLGPVDLRKYPIDLSWEWCPGWGRGFLVWCVSVDSSLVRGRGNIAYSLLAREYRLSDADFRLYVKDYPVDLGGFRSGLEATGTVRFTELAVASGDVPLKALVAEGEWADVVASEFKLGSYQWRATLEAANVLASSFSGGSDRFKLEGQASLDPGKGTYRYKVNVTTEDAQLFSLLESRANASRNGTLSFSKEGRL